MYTFVPIMSSCSLSYFKQIKCICVILKHVFNKFIIFKQNSTSANNTNNKYNNCSLFLWDQCNLCFSNSCMNSTLLHRTMCV